MKRLLALLLLAGLAPAPAASSHLTEHVVIVIVDGARYTETLGDPSFTWVPRQGFNLAPLGTRTETFLNLGLTQTLPGHAAVATGTWQPIANDGSERPHKPTLFEYFRLFTGAPPESAWLVTGKVKLWVIGFSDRSGYGAPYGAATDPGLGADAVTMNHAIDHLLTDRPALLFVNLSDVDYAGHSGDWPAYLDAITVADSLIYHLWGAIQADPVLSGKTTLIVTNDHGRHDDAHGGFTNHGDDCPGCRRLQMLMVGPDTRVNHVSPVVYRQIDIARTVGELLQFPTPLSDGWLMNDVLVAPVVGHAGETPRSCAFLGPPTPNPSEGSLHLPLSVAREGVLRAFVADVLGRRVAVLFEGPCPAGVLDLDWNGCNGAGEDAGSGVYFIQAEIGRDKVTQRAVIAR